MSNKKARDVMSSDCTCIGENDSVLDAAKRLAELDVGSLPICGADDRLKGMLTDRDIVVKVLAEGRDPTSVKAGELGVGDGNTVTIGADDPIDEALRTMIDHKVAALRTMIDHKVAAYRSSTTASSSGSSARPTSPPTSTKNASATSSRRSPPHPDSTQEGDDNGRTSPRRQRRVGRHLPVHELRLRPAGRLHAAPAALPELRQRHLEHPHRRRQHRRPVPVDECARGVRPRRGPAYPARVRGR
jgi:CBS domain-containing protein